MSELGPTGQDVPTLEVASVTVSTQIHRKPVRTGLVLPDHALSTEVRLVLGIIAGLPDETGTVKPIHGYSVTLSEDPDQAEAQLIGFAQAVGDECQKGIAAWREAHRQLKTAEDNGGDTKL